MTTHELSDSEMDLAAYFAPILGEQIIPRCLVFRDDSDTEIEDAEHPDPDHPEPQPKRIRPTDPTLDNDLPSFIPDPAHIAMAINELQVDFGISERRAKSMVGRILNIDLSSFEYNCTHCAHPEHCDLCNCVYSKHHGISMIHRCDHCRNHLGCDWCNCVDGNLDHAVYRIHCPETL